MPALARAFWQAGVGPVSMMAGSEPTTEAIVILARGLRPAFLPAAALPIKQIAAPSTMPEELPAWWT